MFDMPKSPILLHYNTKKPVLKFKRHVASNTEHLLSATHIVLELKPWKMPGCKNSNIYSPDQNQTD
jgi:hypothetical protein